MEYFFNAYTVSLIIAYLLGSIPFGIIITKLFNKGDLRKVGSGNIGATNVMRVGGLRMAGLVWILDMLKAVAAVWLCGFFGPSTFGQEYSAVVVAFGVWGGLAAIVGHCFPVWLKFHGGKGVSCLFGVLLAVNPVLFVICGLIWLLIAMITKYSSAGALAVFCLLPFLGFLTGVDAVGFAFLVIAILCLWQHRGNIVRLFSGKESKIEWKWKK